MTDPRMSIVELRFARIDRELITKARQEYAQAHSAELGGMAVASLEAIAPTAQVIEALPPAVTSVEF